jgi:chromosome segregation ATPase
MNESNLGDFRPGNPKFDDSDPPNESDAATRISESGYHQEINTIRIDKLSNKITIISVIIPCLIGAILIYAYLDIKERVVDVDVTKQNQVDKVSQQLEEKLNALDVKIAKNRFDLDKTLPELDEKNKSLEGQVSKLTTQKADSETLKTQFSEIEKKIEAIASQDKKSIQSMTKFKSQIESSIKTNQTKVDASAKQIKDDIALFKEEFDARLLELSDYDLQIGELRKNVSLLDKMVKNLEQQMVTHTTLEQGLADQKTELASQMMKLDSDVQSLSQQLSANISRLQKDIDLLIKTAAEADSSTPVSKPEPQVSIEPDGIEEESLSQ